jgi:hypothetical protein
MMLTLIRVTTEICVWMFLLAFAGQAVSGLIVSRWGATRMGADLLQRATRACLASTVFGLIYAGCFQSAFWIVLRMFALFLLLFVLFLDFEYDTFYTLTSSIARKLPEEERD